MASLIAKNFQLVKFSQVDFLIKKNPPGIKTDGDSVFLNHENNNPASLFVQTDGVVLMSCFQSTHSCRPQ